MPCIVEQRLSLDLEVSVVLARHRDGSTATYPVAENVHRHGILDLTVVPARVDPAIADAAQRLGTQIAEALDYVGVLAVELFVSDGQLFVNELAPRPHNSGHWTLDAAATSQFAQQIRAVTGCRTRATTMTSPAVAMVNLLGDLWFPAGAGEPVEPSWATVLADPTSRLHLYGKAAPRPGRKMGHLTVLGDSADEVAERALTLREGVVPKSNELRRRRLRRRWTGAPPAGTDRRSVRRRRAAPAPARRRRRPAGRDRGEPRPPPPVHAMGRSGPRDHRNVRLQGRRGLVDRRELQLSGDRTGHVRRRRSGPRRLRTPPARRTGNDRDRLLAAPRGRRPGGDDGGRGGADVCRRRPSTASSASRSAAT